MGLSVYRSAKSACTKSAYPCRAAYARFCATEAAMSGELAARLSAIAKLTRAGTAVRRAAAAGRGFANASDGAARHAPTALSSLMMPRGSGGAMRSSRLRGGARLHAQHAVDAVMHVVAIPSVSVRVALRRRR